MEDTDLHGQTPDQAAADPISYVYPIGYSNSSECGYCRQTRSGQSGKRWSYYAIANSLKPAFYQKLVDRFWRRSGSLLYRPNQKNSCCPHYTLRLDSSQFKPTKDQRQAVNRFNRHVLGDNYARDAARLYPRSREEVRRRNNEFDLVERIHEAEAKFCKGGPPPPRAHEFVVTLEPDAFTDEKYAVFENYQRIIHREPPEKITELGFKRFLCNSPLRREKIVGDDGKERQLGSFHQCYRLDGKLVAVGVLDLLPDCVSAVYFLYHESIHSLNPGKLGALREIALAKELGYRWWYSGYYVHNCAKMRYKIDYKPQYVLDPETLAWDLVDEEVLALFDKYPYVCLSRERKKKKKEQDEEGRDQNPDQHGDEDDGKEKSEVDGGSSSSVDSGDESFLLTSDMPGILSLGEMMDVDLSMLQLRSDLTDRLILLSELVIWDTEHISEYGTLKSKIAELVAAIGPDLMGEICIDFRRKQRG